MLCWSAKGLPNSLRGKKKNVSGGEHEPEKPRVRARDQKNSRAELVVGVVRVCAERVAEKQRVGEGLGGGNLHGLHMPLASYSVLAGVSVAGN
jgi:hypothetical protein